MNGSSDDGLRRSVDQLSNELARVTSRLDAIEQALKLRLDEQISLMDKRALRTGELASRVAQRVARLESIVELMHHTESAEQMDHA